MPNPAAWYSQGEPDVQAVACFVDPTTGAQYVANASQGLPVATGVPVVTSLAAGTSATGAGTALNGNLPHNNHTLVVLTSAGVTAGAVQLQGSLDNVNWFNLGSALSTTAATTVYSVSVANTPFQYIRANVTSTITGGTITAWVASA